MSGKKKTAPAVKASEGGAGNQISGQAIGNPATQYSMSGITAQGVGSYG